jgi:hypothetical protein
MDLRTGQEVPSNLISKDSYPWRDLKHQMETVALLNMDSAGWKLLYFIKLEEPIKRWGG